MLSPEQQKQSSDNLTALVLPGLTGQIDLPQASVLANAAANDSLPHTAQPTGFEAQTIVPAELLTTGEEILATPKQVLTNEAPQTQPPLTQSPLKQPPLTQPPLTQPPLVQSGGLHDESGAPTGHAAALPGHETRGLVNQAPLSASPVDAPAEHTSDHHPARIPAGPNGHAKNAEQHAPQVLPAPRHLIADPSAQILTGEATTITSLENSDAAVVDREAAIHPVANNHGHEIQKEVQSATPAPAIAAAPPALNEAVEVVARANTTQPVPVINAPGANEAPDKTATIPADTAPAQNADKAARSDKAPVRPDVQVAPAATEIAQPALKTIAPKMAVPTTVPTPALDHQFITAGADKGSNVAQPAATSGSSDDGATNQEHRPAAPVSLMQRLKTIKQAPPAAQTLDTSIQNALKTADAVAPVIAPTAIGEIARPAGTEGLLPTPGNPTTPQVPLNNIAVHIAAQLRAGNQRFEIRLDPPELGRIDIRLEIGRDGTTLTHLAVEKPETLDLLRQDARQLERALSNAGLDSRDGNLSFSLKEDSRNKQQTADSEQDGPQVNSDQASDLEDTDPSVMTRTVNISSGIDISI